MGNLGLTEMLLIGVALLLFFGPSKLPALGKSLGEFKKGRAEGEPLAAHAAPPPANDKPQEIG